MTATRYQKYPLNKLQEIKKIMKKKWRDSHSEREQLEKRIKELQKEVDTVSSQIITQKDPNKELTAKFKIKSSLQATNKETYDICALIKLKVAKMKTSFRDPHFQCQRSRS